MTLLALFLLFAGQDGLDPRVPEIQQRLGRVEQAVDRQRVLVEQELSRPNSTCTAEIRLFTKPQGRLQSPSRTLAPDARFEVGLSAAVSTPTNHCLPAQIVTRATYFDANNNFLCSGSVVTLQQTEHTQVILLEFYPWRTREFVQWKNGPAGSLPSELLCLDRNKAVILEPWLARTLRVQLTALPRNGGVASVEFDVTLEVPEQ
jgi:hypothetical protein